MENFVNNEKFKSQLEHEIDNIIDQKRFVYDQIKKLEKEESILNYNILFFENYLRFLNDSDEMKLDEMNLEDFSQFINKMNSQKAPQIKKPKLEAKMNIDLIDENIKAFDETFKKTKNEKSDKRKISEEKEKRQSGKKDLQTNNYLEKESENFIDEDFKSINLKEENYFKDLIKRNFEN